MLYTTNFSSANISSLQRYTLPITGTPTPVATLTQAQYVHLESIAIDASGQVYCIANNVLTSQVSAFVYAANPTSTSSPARTLNFSDQAYLSAVDAASNLYTSDGHTTVNVYPPTANGTVTPARTIIAPSNITAIDAIATDASSSLYVLMDDTNAHLETVAVYSPTATGTATPIRSFTLGNDASYYMAVDGSGDVFLSKQVGPPDQVIEFSSTATGAATPTRTITLPYPPGTTQESIYTIAADAIGNLYVSYMPYTTSTDPNEIAVYSSTATGTATPTSTIPLPQDYFGFLAIH